MDTERTKKLIAVLQWDRTYSEKDRIEFDKIAKAAVKRKQPIPDYVKPRPELRVDLVFYYNAYVELSRNGFSFSECRDYAEYYSVSFEQLRYMMRILHSGY